MESRSGRSRDRVWMDSSPNVHEKNKTKTWNILTPNSRGFKLISSGPGAGSWRETQMWTKTLFGTSVRSLLRSDPVRENVVVSPEPLVHRSTLNHRRFVCFVCVCWTTFTSLPAPPSSWCYRGSDRVSKQYSSKHHRHFFVTLHTNVAAIFPLKHKLCRNVKNANVFLLMPFFFLPSYFRWRATPPFPLMPPHKNLRGFIFIF